MSNPNTTREPEIPGFDALAELALDLRWSFNHAADEIWRRLDPALWQLTHNPWFVLQTASRSNLEAVTADSDWAIGAGTDRVNAPGADAAEADALYALLESEVVTAFYTRDDGGLPHGWIARMRESMARLTPTFSANRSVREYTETHYVRAAVAFRERVADGGQGAADVLGWRKALEETWNGARFGAVDVRADGAQYVFRVPLDLGQINPDHVQVELYADGRDGSAPIRQPMAPAERAPGVANGFVYMTTIATSRPPGDFTPRLIPYHVRGCVPLEAPWILWGEAH